MGAHVQFQWKCCPQAEAFVQEVLDKAVRANEDVDNLQKQLVAHTSSRLFDWLDHVVIGGAEQEKRLEEVGYALEETAHFYRVFSHPGAQLPRVVLRDHDQEVVGISVVVDKIADFLMVQGKAGWIEGAPNTGFRRCLISTKNGISFWVVERRGGLTIEPTYPIDSLGERYIEALEMWQTRPRHLEDEDDAFDRTMQLAEDMVRSIGADLAACAVLEVERRYWQARNLAGQLQKGRQDRVGMGWANHDHHTFRSSRKHFCRLVRLFEMLGFHCRERFYAGAEAGWGAQVMENPRARLILFLDVDLAPHELDVDFAHHQLPELPRLGTIGLWCALHGDSILQAGMHHLEAQFLFDQLTEDLHKIGVGMMTAFSDFPYLKQAFTHGEVWHVNPVRVDHLLKKGMISKEQAKKFLTHGAVGSHLENLQRREGYKGFNQKNVSVIIKETDPRRF